MEIHMERHKMVKRDWTKNEFRRLTLSDFKNYYEATLIRQQREQLNGAFHEI